jgi:hypothetical protein
MATVEFQDFGWQLEVLLDQTAYSLEILFRPALGRDQTAGTVPQQLRSAHVGYAGTQKHLFEARDQGVEKLLCHACDGFFGRALGLRELQVCVIERF